VHSTYPTYPTYCDTNERTRDTRPCNHLVERPVETQRDVLFARSSGIAILQLAQSDVRPSAPHRGRTTGESRMAPFRLSPSSPLPSPLPIFSLFSLSLSLSSPFPCFSCFSLIESSDRRRYGGDSGWLAVNGDVRQIKMLDVSCRVMKSTKARESNVIRRSNDATRSTEARRNVSVTLRNCRANGRAMLSSQPR
jgi:hypothetical protein